MLAQCRSYVSQFGYECVRILTMPPLPPVPEVLRAQVLWSDGDDPRTTSTIYLSYSGASPDGSDCAGIAAQITTAFAAHAGLWDIDTALQGCVVTDLNADDGATGEHEASTQGTRSGTPFAGATCTVVSYSIARRYRGGRPRNYFPWGVPADLADKQGWSGAYIAEVTTAWTAISTALKAITQGGTTISDHVNVSYYSGSVGSITGGGTRGKTTPIRRATPLVNPTTSFIVPVTPGSQRRRNRA